jgi:hypothetical protein
MQDHFPARRGATGFDEAQVPLRDCGIAGKRELAKAAALSPCTQEISDWGCLDGHVSTVAQRSARSNYLGRNRRVARLRVILRCRRSAASASITSKGAFYVDHPLTEVSAYGVACRCRDVRCDRPLDDAWRRHRGETYRSSGAVAALCGHEPFPRRDLHSLVGTRDSIAPAGVWVVIIGNALWVSASALLLLGGMIAPNALGYVVIGAQAAAVALLAELEYFGLRMNLAVAH